ncbi:hypothetical protein LCGC14_1624190 [marine sediment metagenome]|uniref:DUF559 domain-containing protein n=1 Tax=marine sediment metagenome TaxID=412755 RepID=A0A0F9IRP5_9ZZZZ
MSTECKTKISNTMKGRTPVEVGWNRGLTKDTDSRVRKNSENLMGHSITKASKKLMSKKGRDHLTKDPNNCQCGPHSAGQRTTRIERVLREVLLSEFPEVVEQKRFGRYVVDAYLPPPYHLAFEANGQYRHNRSGYKERNAARDLELMENFNLPVVRLGEFELREMENAF